jgi:hypothetical protein
MLFVSLFSFDEYSRFPEHINFHGGIQWVGCYTSDGAFGNVVNNSYWHGLPGYSAWQLQHNNAMPTGLIRYNSTLYNMDIQIVSCMKIS